jgi:hypothetical protein
MLLPCSTVSTPTDQTLIFFPAGTAGVAALVTGCGVVTYAVATCSHSFAVIWCRHQTCTGGLDAVKSSNLQPQHPHLVASAQAWSQCSLARCRHTTQSKLQVSDSRNCELFKQARTLYALSAPTLCQSAQTRSVNAH